MAKYFELDNGKKFMIVSKHKLDNKKYMLIVSVNENPEFVFVECLGKDQLSPVKDQTIIEKLTLQTGNKIFDHYKKLK